MTTEDSKPSAEDVKTPPDDEQVGSFVTELAAALTQGAFQLAARSSEVPLRMARAVLADRRDPETLQPDNLKLMYDAGLYLRDLRTVTGLTIKDLASALDMKDSTLLESVEAGTATLPFETILRLASLVARNDPVPFVIRMVRSYNPEAWGVLQNWGIGRLPLQLERERQFINIYRGHDKA
ncbi:MAG: helix-turn-helix domain-containing protein, partial [Gammaproteobacteria bacterium]|nr:helix-turn-helix domain-containing protein [Gammaproteobacteria bacterium]